MRHFTVYPWKQLPLLRILIPFTGGILIQFFQPFAIQALYLCAGGCIACGVLYYLLPAYQKFAFRWFQGLCIQLVVLIAGGFLVYHQDVRNHEQWIGHTYHNGSPLLVSLNEPLVEKARSYKANVRIEAVQQNGIWHSVKGNMLVYFKKDSLIPYMTFGARLIFKKPLQPITNSGNPGAFDYQRYCAFQDIYHQVFLQTGEYVLIPNTRADPFKKWLFDLRDGVIHTLREYIPGEREKGVAEALLIGYKDDLDKGLVQAYSNTGVVHIIAISGLHLGLIYAIMIWLLRPLKKIKCMRWVKPVMILGVLWVFSLLAGAAPSILRAAVMFTCIVFGEAINRRASTYNALIVSAFCMLWYNPYFLWDVGFQLSYAAVISILAFNRPVYNWFYFQNKLLDGIWKLNAVTLSAQVLTLPVILYYFHQFPNFFLVTNFVAVPLSGWILFAELGLLICAQIPFVAIALGKVCSAMLRVMNGFIEWMDQLPLAVTNDIKINAVQAVLLTACLSWAGYGLLRKKKTSLIAALVAAVLFTGIRAVDMAAYVKNEKLIVYNVSQHTGIDFISGLQYWSMSDTALTTDPFLQNFHLRPCRVMHRTTPASRLESLVVEYPFFVFNSKRIVLIDQTFHFRAPEKLKVDLIVLSKNPKIQIPELLATFTCTQFVLDGSNSVWKINRWKKDCDSLHLRYYSTMEKGAFEWNL